MDLIKGEPERLLPGGLRARGARDGASRRAPGGPEARGDHGLGRPVPRLDRDGARQGVDEGGPPASGVVDGAEDHDRLGDDDEQGSRGDRSALPLRSRVLADPRVDPSRGGGARDRRVPRRIDAGGDGDGGHAPADPARPGVARTAPDRRGVLAPHGDAAHVRARGPRSVPGGGPRLPRRWARPHLPRGDERGERGGRDGVPRGEDPAPAHRRRSCRRSSTNTNHPRSFRSCTSSGRMHGPAVARRRSSRLARWGASSRSSASWR